MQTRFHPHRILSGPAARLHFARGTAATEPDAAGGAAEEGPVTILAVDDDVAIAALLRDLLESVGYRVLTAVNGAQAVERSEADPEPVHLLLTDVLLPDVTGPELFGRLRLQRPRLRVVYMTGHPFHDVGDVPEDTLIRKPFTVQRLLEAVHDALAH